MREERKAGFTQKWIEDAVKKLLQKDDIYESDMKKIKYLRIGVNFDCGCGYIIEMSTEVPPEPFYDTDGGDEWETGGGGATVTGRFIQSYIDYIKENHFESIDPDTGEQFLQLSQFGFWSEFKKEYDEAGIEEYREDWEDTVKNWKSFEKTILYETYKENFDSDDAFGEWEQQAGRAIQQDIGLFTGLEVLRIQGTEYQDMTFLRAMPLLRVLEVVETQFASLEGIDGLVQLKQLCCWLD